jgi:hypothetical protein
MSATWTSHPLLPVSVTVFVAALILVAAVPTPAHTGWSCDPQVNVPVCTASNAQIYPKAVTDGGGGVIVAWRDYRSGVEDVYAQHLLASGEVDPGWPANGVAVCTAANRQESIVIVPDGDGGAFVAWDDERLGEYTERVYVQHVLASGVVDPDWPVDGRSPAPAVNQQLGPRLQPDGAGGVFVTWYCNAGSAGYNVYAQHILASGMVDPEWNAGGMFVCSANGDQDYHVITSDDAGGILVAWEDDRSGSETDIYAQHVLPYGVRDPGWPVHGRAICLASGSESFVEIVADGAGGAIITWEDYRAPGFDSYIYAQHLQADGQVDAAWPTNGRLLCSQTGGQSFPLIASDGDGGAIVAWTDGRSVDPAWDIYAQRVLANGAVDPAWPTAGLAVCSHLKDQYLSDIIPWGIGGALVTWHDYRSTVDYDIYVQRLLPAGTVDPGWPVDGLAIGTATGFQDHPSIAPSGENHAIVVWNDGRPGSDLGDIYGQLVMDDGTFDDQMEDNDVCGGNDPLPAGWYPGLITRSTDTDWHKISVPRSSQVIITVEFTHADGDIDIELYDGVCSTVLDISGGSTDTEIVSFLNTGPAVDVNLVVYPYANDCNGYNMNIAFVGSSNLDALVTPTGWFGPAVPRNQNNATVMNVQPTPVLDGNAPTTYLNWATVSEGPINLPVWSSTVAIDRYPVVDMWIGDNSPMGTYVSNNTGPFVVRGGRHTVSVIADRDEAVPESDESDNDWGLQWIWSPLEMAFETPVVRLVPPTPGLWAEPNADGMKFDRDANNAWVTSIAARNEGDDYDLWVYDDYSSSTVGFSNRIAVSGATSNATDFVVGNWLGTPTTVYPAAMLWSPDGGGGEFSADQSDARFRNGNMGLQPEIIWSGEALAANRLTNVYDAYLEVGVTYSLTLVPLGGNPGLLFEVFPGAAGGSYSRGAGELTSGLLGGGMLFSNYTATETGWHPIVVFRDTGSGAGEAVAYDFHWRIGAVDVPGQEPPAFTLAFHGAWPNPMTEQARIVFDLARRGPVSLNVFDLRGRLVSTIVDATLEPGPHSVAWAGQGRSGARLGAGIYWMRFEAEGREFVKRVVLLK